MAFSWPIMFFSKDMLWSAKPSLKKQMQAQAIASLLFSHKRWAIWPFLSLSRIVALLRTKNLDLLCKIDPLINRWETIVLMMWQIPLSLLAWSSLQSYLLRTELIAGEIPYLITLQLDKKAVEIKIQGVWQGTGLWNHKSCEVGFIIK